MYWSLPISSRLMFLSQNDTLYFIHETSHSTCMFCASQIAFWATKNKCPVQEVTWNFMFRSVASLHSHVEQWEPKFFFWTAKAKQLKSNELFVAGSKLSSLFLFFYKDWWIFWVFFFFSSSVLLESFNVPENAALFFWRKDEDGE